MQSYKFKDELLDIKQGDTIICFDGDLITDRKLSGLRLCAIKDNKYVTASMSVYYRAKIVLTEKTYPKKANNIFAIRIVPLKLQKNEK